MQACSVFSVTPGPTEVSPLVSISDHTGLGEMSTITGVIGTTSYTGTYLKAASNYKYQWDIEVADGYTITEAKVAFPTTGVTSPEDVDPEDWHDVNVGTPTDNIYSFQHAGNDYLKWYKFTISNGTDTETYSISMYYDGPRLVENLLLADSTNDVQYVTDETNTTYTEVQASEFTTLDQMWIKVGGYLSGDYEVNVTGVTVNGTAVTLPTKDEMYSEDGLMCTYTWDGTEVAAPTLDAGNNEIVVTATRGSETKTYTFNLNRS